MRIALCGPGGSGKSVLAQSLSKIFDVPVLPSAMRLTIEYMGLVTSQLASLPIEVRIALQTRALILHVQHELNARGGFASDRTIWDFMAYLMAFVDPDSREAHWYRELPVMMGALPYTHVIYVPPFSDAVPDDGVRFTGSGVWVEDKVRQTMLDIVRTNFPAVVVLREKTVDARIAEILRETNLGGHCGR